MKIPDLRAEFTDIELDQITLLLEQCIPLLAEAFGDDDITADEFDPVRVREEMISLFPPQVFANMIVTSEGRAFALGVWFNAFVLSPANDIPEEMVDEINELLGFDPSDDDV